MTDFTQAAEAATLALRGLFDPTPLLRNDLLSQKFDADIWLKREDLTPVRSYKLRGAFNAMRKIRAAWPEMRISSAPVPGTMRRGWPSPAGISA